MAIVEEVLRERKRQDAQWGPASPLTDMLPVLIEEVGEVAEALQDRDVAQQRVELIQVAAVAIKWIEIIDLYSKKL